ncbi:MAG: hypothetical protein ABIP94_11185 [Planctomycetota bacterium]
MRAATSLHGAIKSAQAIRTELQTQVDWEVERVLREKARPKRDARSEKAPHSFFADEEWERFRGDVQREAGELRRTAPAASDTMAAQNHLLAGGQKGCDATVPQKGEDGADAPPCFLRDGGGWTIEFGNKRAIVKHLTGMPYLQRLLSKPGVPIAAASFEGTDAESPSSEQDITDDQGIREIKAALEDVDEDIAEAKEHGREGSLEDLYVKKEAIQDQMRQAIFMGRKRRMKSSNSAANDRVRAAIRRAIGAIAAQHEALGEHLSREIRGKGGASPVYDPRPPITWRVNP